MARAALRGGGPASPDLLLLPENLEICVTGGFYMLTTDSNKNTTSNKSNPLQTSGQELEACGEYHSFIHHSFIHSLTLLPQTILLGLGDFKAQGLGLGRQSTNTPNSDTKLCGCPGVGEGAGEPGRETQCLGCSRQQSCLGGRSGHGCVCGRWWEERGVRSMPAGRVVALGLGTIHSVPLGSQATDTRRL